MPNDRMNDFLKVAGELGIIPEPLKENKMVKTPKSKERQGQDTSKEMRNKSDSNHLHQMANLGYSFQTQDYYGLNTDVEQDVKNIINYRLDNINKNSNRQKELQDLTKVIGLESESTFFKAKVMYPGLVVGMSNPTMCSIKQNAEDSNDEKSNKNFSFKTGFTFDYVTGLPYIPGSSIKGMLRNSIIKYEEDVKEYLGLAKDFKINDLAEELFGDEQKHANSELRDVFLEAIVVKGDKEGFILKEDYITPHKTPFSDPKPIHILALRPNVEIEFYFVLKEGEVAGIKKKDRFDLYKNLILDLGIGAKTNTGYGSLIELESEAKTEIN